LAVLALTAASCAPPDPVAPADLSVARLFSSKEFDSQDPGMVVWCPRTPSSYLTRVEPAEPRPGNPPAGATIARVDVLQGTTTTLVTAAELTPPGEARPLTIDAFQVAGDESRLLLGTNGQRVWRRKTRGDYWVFDLARRTLVRLGGEAPPATMQFAKFSPDGTQVAFVRENNLYVQQLDGLRILPLTTDGSSTCINGTADWVNEEELDIRDGFRWSPDGQSIAFWQFDTRGVPQFHLIDNASGLYPRITSFAYPKVGQVNSATRIGVVDARGGAVRWMAVPGDPRQHYLPSLQWAPAGRRLLLQQLNRLQNTNRVMVADTDTGATTPVLTEQDDAWVDSEGPVTWLDGGRAFLWLSERDGWRQVYRVSTDGTGCTRVTPGGFDVLDIEAVDAGKGLLYYSASPEDPTQRHLFRVPLAGGAPERLSPAGQPGWHTYTASPDTQWAVHTYSTFTAPPVVTLIRFGDHAPVRVLADNAALAARLSALRRPTTGFMRVDIGEGVALDGWFIHPPDLDPRRSYPLMFYVYGEPAGQTVRNAWGGQTGLWHWMLAQAGYLVVSVDTRGTRAPRGRAWRKSVYRQIGILPPADFAAAARALLQRWPFADPRRVGVWGWSGGGSNTLHAIFRHPDLFHTAIAVAPNADQLLYDSIYQERYMGSPSDNAEGYRLGSPITHAGQLRGNLLLIHGTGDDNGHYQGTEKLINQLVRQGKHFTVMPYPARSHALSEGDNTVAHLYTLMTRYLADHLAADGAGTRPAARGR
jgi:dipeptidyl-peptidase-4